MAELKRMQTLEQRVNDQILKLDQERKVEAQHVTNQINYNNTLSGVSAGSQPVIGVGHKSRDHSEDRW